MHEDLKARDRSILQAIISSYITTGEPVGSRYLSRKLNLNLSPATIRNIMADMEEMGFLKQPHISAGRVPTDKAYRFYVDCMVSTTPGDSTIPTLDKIFRALSGQSDNLMRDTSRALSDVSHYIGLVMAPKFINTVLKHMEFVRLKKRKVLAILVSQEGLIQNHLVTTDTDYSQKDLDAMSAFLNATYASRPLREVRAAILVEMAEDKRLYDSLLEKAISLGRNTLSLEGAAGDVYVEGTSNILSLPDFTDMEKMAALFKSFEEKNHLMEMLDRCIDAEGVKIFIGAENPYHELQDLSLVSAPYSKGGQVLGVIGVLGPTRMDYNRVISMVSYTADYLTRMITQRP